MDCSIHHSLQDCWVLHPLAVSTNIAFNADFLFTIQKGSRNFSHMNKVIDSAKLFQKKAWQRTLEKNVNTGITSLPTCGTRTRSRSPIVLQIGSYPSQTTTASANSSPSSSMHSTFLRKCGVCYNVSNTTSTCPFLSKDTRIQIVMARSQKRIQPINLRYCNNDKRFFSRQTVSQVGCNNN